VNGDHAFALLGHTRERGQLATINAARPKGVEGADGDVAGSVEGESANVAGFSGHGWRDGMGGHLVNIGLALGRESGNRTGGFADGLFVGWAAGMIVNRLRYGPFAIQQNASY